MRATLRVMQIQTVKHAIYRLQSLRVIATRSHITSKAGVRERLIKTSRFLISFGNAHSKPSLLTVSNHSYLALRVPRTNRVVSTVFGNLLRRGSYKFTDRFLRPFVSHSQILSLDFSTRFLY